MNLCLRPRGRSGLKSSVSEYIFDTLLSPSSRAEWVEIFFCMNLIYLNWSPSSRAEWVEINEAAANAFVAKSPSSRAEWVEILLGMACKTPVGSPSSRAEWVEIPDIERLCSFAIVSVLAGGVG